MGVKNGCSSSSIPLKISLVVLLVSNGLSWIAFCTASWSLTSDSGYGLWRICAKDGVQCNPVDGTNLDWYVAVQAFGCFGFISLNAALLLVVLYMFKDTCMGNGEMKIGAAILCFLGAATWLICVAVYGGKWTKDDRAAASDLNYSFGLAVVALFLAILGGILVILGNRRGALAHVTTP